MKTEMSLEGFSEISQSEQQEINGGLISIVAALIVVAVGAGIAEIISDWDNFKNGLCGRAEEK
ncbi:MAG: hypothetical protein GY790_15300 [Bacteroidetes bacterium]|nr:hypothetical protein [Bacteroidota bacterium]